MIYHFEDQVLSESISAGICPSTGFRCAAPVKTAGPTYVLLNPSCDPRVSVCSYQVRVEFQLPGNQDNQDDSSSAHLFNALWYPTATAPVCYGTSCGQSSVCGQAFTGGAVIDGDRATFTATVSGSCGSIPDDERVFSLGVRVCQTNSACRKTTVENNIALGGIEAAREVGCPKPPPPDGCKDPGASCRKCLPGGSGGGGGGPGAGGPGGGPGDGPGTGNGAYLWYQAGGAGHPGYPGSAEWNVTLGRYWSHDYAERIVPDPDEGHVWLLTRYATFREFTDTDADGFYDLVEPSDEERRLESLGPALGWELTDLAGTVMLFDADGNWLSTTDPNQNETLVVYDAMDRLESVHFPDGRREDFAYDEDGDTTRGPDGKLHTITEVGPEGATRVWTYLWNGDDLEEIQRPDGTTVVYT